LFFNFTAIHEIMYGNAFKDATSDRIALQNRLKMRKETVETLISEMLENLTSNLPDDYVMSRLLMHVDEESDSVQVFPNNPGPSTVKIQSEICQSADKDSKQQEDRCNKYRAKVVKLTSTA